MDMALFHSIWTVALLVLFIGIWAWAWSNKRKKTFDAAARQPLEEGEDLIRPTQHGEKNHG